MDREQGEIAARLVVLLCLLAMGGISVIVFAIYWFGCRQSRIPGVVLRLPNSVPPNTVLVPNPTGAPNVSGPGQNVVGPQYVMMASPINDHAQPNVGAQYPAAVSGASGAHAGYTLVHNQERPPSYSQTCPETVEKVPGFK